MNKPTLILILLFFLALLCPPAQAAPATVTVATTPTQIVSQDSSREWILICNPTTNTAAVFIGLSGNPTTSTGEELQPGETLLLSGLAARQSITGIVASGTQVLRIQKP